MDDSIAATSERLLSACSLKIALSFKRYEQNWRALSDLKAKGGWKALPKGFVTSSRIAEKLISQGMTAWHLPFFYQDVRDVLGDFLCSDRQYPIATFIARFLLETLPENPLDPDLKDFLLAIEGYNYFKPPRALQSEWPAPSDFYGWQGNWEMAATALDAEMNRRADKRVKFVQMMR